MPVEFARHEVGVLVGALPHHEHGKTVPRGVDVGRVGEAPVMDPGIARREPLEGVERWSQPDVVQHLVEPFEGGLHRPAEPNRELGEDGGVVVVGQSGPAAAPSTAGIPDRYPLWYTAW